VSGDALADAAVAGRIGDEEVDRGGHVIRGAAPDDEHVNVGRGVRHQLATPQSRASGMMCSANMVMTRRATSVGMPGRWK
jgi:hypothetical protein